LNESQLPDRLRLLLRINTVRVALAEFEIKIEFAKLKTPKGGQKESAQREGHDGQASRVKNFQRPAMLQTTPLYCE